MNEFLNKNDREEMPDWLATLISKLQISPDLERRSRAAGRSAYAIDRMRKERKRHSLAALPLDRYLRGLAELAGVRLDGVLTSLGLPALDRVTSASAPLMARLARLVGLGAREAELFTR